MSVTSKLFGTTKRGEPVTAYTLSNGSLTAVLLDYGATLQALYVPDAHGGVTDVVLGYDSVEEYELNSGFLGATVGRMGNRVGGAEFTLNGVSYKLAANDGENCLHGGLRGFDKYIWQAEAGEDRLRFSRLSPDGEENFPGNLSVSVCYILEGTTLRIVYDGVTDRPGVQLYTANFLSKRRGKDGRELFPRCALCLETQLYPNAMRCQGFPSPVLKKGEPLHSETALRFGLL